MKMARTLLVFLHGSGGNGPELRTFLDSVPLEQFGFRTFRSIANEKNIEYVCPTANKRSYTPAMGEKMNVWFDRSENFHRRGIEDPVEDVVGANDSVNQVNTISFSLISLHFLYCNYVSVRCVCFVETYVQYRKVIQIDKN